MVVRRTPWAVVAACYVVAYIVLTATHSSLIAHLGAVASPVASLPLNFGSAWLYWIAARRRDFDVRLRRALWLAGGAMAAVFLGQCGDLVVQFVEHRDFSLAWPIGIFLLYYPLMLGALLSLPHARRARLEWWKFALDAATVVLGGAVVVWYFVLHPTASTPMDPRAVLVAFAFPIGDLVLLFGLTTLVLRRTAEGPPTAFRFLVLAQFSGISADLIGSVLLPATGTLNAMLPDSLYFITAVLTIASGELYARESLTGRDGGETATGLSRYQLGSPLPYVAAGFVYLLLLTAAVRARGSALSDLVVAAAPVTVLLTARGLVSARQNARLLTERGERAGQARLVALLDATTDFVGVANDTGEMAYINPAGRRMIGLADTESVREMSLRDITATIPPKKDGVWEGESVVRTRDGQEVPVSQVIVAHTSPQGDRSVATIMRDISGWKHLDRVKSEFVSTVSHELRTPLTAIRGSLGLLEGGGVTNLPPKALNLLRIARNNCDRLVRLLNDMLDLDKIEAGKLALRAVPLEPAEVVGAALDELRPMADQRAIALVEDLAPVPPVTGDRDRLIQVLTNLVSNAIKFSPAAATVTVSITAVEHGVRFAVHNPGPGIAPHDMPRLFGRFQQLDGSDRRRHGGTGLGLAIAKAIVEQHEGTIGVESDPGAGTTFWFVLRYRDRLVEVDVLHEV
ncbi:MAG TPA: ATP-binding protein [Gemmatimonadaceae bacterium]|jgi:signal transduction histidine kinase|nr:ATP-binding protein [Gemmatimonadaceae bacterium]